MSNKARVITFANTKGGVGKSACATLLARYYAEVEEKRVIYIDLDIRAGITYFLSGGGLGKDYLSITEVLQAAGTQGNFQEVFSQALYDTGLNKNQNWTNNKGRLFLLPTKPNLKAFLTEYHHSLLGEVIHNIPLPDDVIILIDPGAIDESVMAAVNAADVVFTPWMTGQGDVQPVFETLSIILAAQGKRENRKPLMGGFILNRPRKAQWVQEYIEQWTQVLGKFRNESGMRFVSTDNFFFLEDSRTIDRGSHLECPFREDFYEFTKKLADIVDQA